MKKKKLYLSFFYGNKQELTKAFNKITDGDFVRYIMTAETLICRFRSNKKIDEIIKLAKYMAYTIDTHWKWHAAEETDLSLMIKKIANNEVTDEEINLAQKYDPDNYMLTGTSKQITELCEKIKIVAKYDNAPVLIYGETGVGKEVAARLLHKGSKRCEKAFVAVNCAGIPANLMEDMLFGHKKGAFTDAKEDKKGLFEAADGGTIFLDEITEMSMEVQAKLLRFLEDFNIIPLGTTETKKVDVRIIAATNENIKEKINEKKFRADLYYRISGVELYIPSLRERKEDIKQIANVILYRFYEEYGFKRRILSKKEIAILESYDWPGNVRQLQKFLMRCIIFNAKDNEFIKILKEITSDNVKFNEDTITDNKIITIAEAEKSAIKSALKICNWNKTIAAKELGIALNTLKAKMEEFGIKK